ncbi:YkgJ family cysteine cluster protein [Candidatus Woesearchaeota archaeon]|nr:YkgJ family cysteine cluster protein [Candidatus Woesearchaeota archaeon]
MAEEITCEKCSGECCKDVSIYYREPKRFDDFEIMKWLIAHKDVCVYVDHKGVWAVEVKTPCKFLGQDSKCMIYPKRYTLCRDYSASECLMSECPGEYYSRIFRTEEDVDIYMKEIGFYEEYLKEKARRENPAGKGPSTHELIAEKKEEAVQAVQPVIEFSQ